MKIEAFFRGIKNANEVVDKLKQEGISAYTDINDHYQLDRNKEGSNGKLLSSPTNSDLVLNTGAPRGERDRSPMLAASPMVSGMGGFEEIADINCKVIVDADPKNKEKAEKIIKSLGGSMRSPNFNVPKHIKDIDLSKGDPDFIRTLE
ncbi:MULTISPECIES: hypothetical protein [Clostridium]|uniref:hypothetical protein n=1 Tax=Clostridium TaxID=1485 RepID=UPI00069DD641|nr:MULTISPECIES: hypothetical protein [Clostridium]KOF58235.1 hypothetical protein AGR56_00280 [Clostridium sp. DMHC 10]MCD2347995.1 hypothetical protein [Clostridium guangxiense]